MKCNLFPFFFSYSLWGGGGGGISGRVRALNLTVPLGSGRVGSDDLGYGPGSGFSFEPVQTSSSVAHTVSPTVTKIHTPIDLISQTTFMLTVNLPINKIPITGLCQSWPPNNPHLLDWLYDSLSSPPVAGVWRAHPLDWLYVSLSSPSVAGVWRAHTLDWLYDSLSSPPVAGVWRALPLDWLYVALSSPPVAGVW